MLWSKTNRALPQKSFATNVLVSAIFFSLYHKKNKMLQKQEQEIVVGTRKTYFQK